MLSTKVFCTLSFEGIHHYPEAPSEVSYLRDMHRHKFGVRVEMEVFDDDREVEFIMLKHRISRYLSQLLLTDESTQLFNLGAASCEQVAKAIVHKLLEWYGERDMVVTVDEDGENGAVVCYDTKDASRVEVGCIA